MNTVFAVLAAYLLGSIPTAYIFGRLLKGVDIRTQGSGNVGATNAFRVLGKGPGTAVLLLDILKGVLALRLIGPFFDVQGVLWTALLGIAAVVGHNWTIFLEFKGGKGIATTLGVLIGLALTFPKLGIVLLLCIMSWGIVFVISGYVSLASMAASVVLPVVMAVTGQPLEMILLGGVFCVFVITRHRPNIKRLLAGQESRVRLFRPKSPH